MKYDSLIDINDGAFDMFDSYSGRRDDVDDDDVLTLILHERFLWLCFSLIKTLKLVLHT